jgi:hypothetical protein
MMVEQLVNYGRRNEVPLVGLEIHPDDMQEAFDRGFQPFTAADKEVPAAFVFAGQICKPVGGE